MPSLNGVQRHVLGERFSETQLHLQSGRLLNAISRSVLLTPVQSRRIVAAQTQTCQGYEKPNLNMTVLLNILNLDKHCCEDV